MEHTFVLRSKRNGREKDCLAPDTKQVLHLPVLCHQRVNELLAAINYSGGFPGVPGMFPNHKAPPSRCEITSHL